MHSSVIDNKTVCRNRDLNDTSLKFNLITVVAISNPVKYLNSAKLV